MKKILSVLLSLAIVATSTAFVHADKYKTAGEKLYDIGLIKGDENGNLMESLPISREDAVIVLMRMLGVQGDAKSYKGNSGFVDVENAKYYSPYIAYARSKGYVDGMGNGAFGVGKKLSQKEMYALILKGLGYRNLQWSRTYADAERAGILDKVDTSKGNTPAYRYQVFDVLLKSLDAKVSGNEQTLKEKLGIASLVEKDKAIIFNIRYDNLKSVDINLAREIKDSEVDKYHFDIKRKNGKHISYTLNRVKPRTIVATLNGSLKNGETIVLTAKNFYDNKNLLPEEEFEIELEDDDEPYIKSVEALDNKTVRVLFSEPVHLNSSSYVMTNYVLTDGRKRSLQFLNRPYTNEVYIKYSGRLPKGEHTLVFQNIYDYSKKLMKKATFEIYVDDTVNPPYVKDVRLLSNKEVLVYFDKPLVQKGSFKIAGSTISNTTFYNDIKDVVKLNLSKKISMAAILGLPLEYRGQRAATKEEVEDWERFEIKVDDDTEMITVSAELISDGYVKIMFSKPMNPSSGVLSLYDKEAKTRETKSSLNFKADTGNRELYVKFNKLQHANSRDFTLEFVGFKDATVRENEMQKTEIDIESKDTKKPELVYKTGRQAVYVSSSPEGKDYDTVTFFFNETMRESDLTDLSNFAVDRSGFGVFSSIDGAEFKEVSDDYKSVTFILPNARVISSSSDFKVSGVRDVAGNVMETVRDAKKISSHTFRLISVEAVEKGKVKFKFTDPVKDFNDYAYVIRKSDEESEVIFDHEINKDDRTEVIATLSGDILTDLSGYRAVPVDDGYKEIHNIYGEALSTKYAKTVLDKVPAEVTSIKVSKGYIEVNFSEKVLFDGGSNSVDKQIMIIDDENHVVSKSNYSITKEGSSDYVNKIKIEEQGEFEFKKGKEYRIQVLYTYDRKRNKSNLFDETIEAN